RTLSTPAGRGPRRHGAVPRARGRRLRHAGAVITMGRRLRRRRARLFSADRRTGGDAQIPPADRAGADRARRHPARAPAGAEAVGRVSAAGAARCNAHWLGTHLSFHKTRKTTGTLNVPVTYPRGSQSAPSIWES